jgi:hypothetical protein
MKMIKGLFIIAVFLLASCSLQAQPTEQPVDQLDVSTAAALTVQAAFTAAAPLATTTPDIVLQMTLTPNSSEARANFDDTINCRKGPGTNYDRIFQTKPGDSFKIVGFFPPSFWVISTDGGNCWVSGEYITPVGNIQSVPTVILPPTPSGGAPDAPSFSQNGWEWFCDGAGQVEVKLTWNDNSNTEKGYRIYRNDTLVTELPLNSTFFKEVFLYPGGQGLKYKVEAFNEVGAASVSTEAMFCD